MLTYYDKSAIRKEEQHHQNTQIVRIWVTTARSIVGVCIRFERTCMHCHFCLLDGRSQFIRHTDYTILHGGEIRKTTFNFQGCEYFRPYIKERTAVATANQTHLNVVRTLYNLHRVLRTRHYAVG